jgi:hypothetical protein
MKAKVAATDLKKAVNALQALQRLSGEGGKKTSEAGGFKGRLQVAEGRLLIDVVNSGAYVQKTIEAKMLREGSIGVDLVEVNKYRLSGTVTIEYDHNVKLVHFSTSKAKYDLPADQDAADIIENTKPTDYEMPIVARIPADTLAQAAALVAIKPGLKQEEMRMQFDLRPADENGKASMEVVGLDFYSYGRCLRRSADIKVKSHTRFILKAVSLSTILGSIEGATVDIGVERNAEETRLVRFKSADADLFYPTLEAAFLDAEEVYKETTQGTINCAFTALRKNIREAIATVKTVSSTSAVPLTLNIKVEGKEVLMAAQEGGKSSMAKIATSTAKARNGGPVVMCLNQHYFESVLNLAPEVTPLQVELWNEKRVIVKAAEGESGRIEYFMAQVDPDLLEESTTS